MGAEAENRWRWVPWLAAWLAVLPVAVLRGGLLAESDTFWETRTGLLILDTGRIPDADVFSWTARGRPWRPNSWAFDVLLGLGHRAAGLAGVALAGTALIMIMAAAVLLLAWWLRAPALAAALALLCGIPACIGWLAARPQLLDYAAVPVLLVLWGVAVTARPGAEAPAPGVGDPRPARRTAARIAAVCGVAVLQAAWVNLHAAATLGVGLTVMASLGWLVSSWRDLRRGWVWPAAVVVAAVAGTAASPYGPDVFRQGLRVRDAAVYIVEWRPMQPTDSTQVLMLATAVTALYVAWRLRRYDILAVVAALAAGGVLVVRLLPIAAFVAIPVLAAAGRLPRPAAWLARWRHVLRPGVAALVLVLAVMGGRAATHLGRPTYPLSPIRALPAGCRLFNDYLIGGPVILLRPDVPVSMDSRTDLYGAEEILAHAHSESGDAGTLDDLRRRGVTCVLVPPGSGLAARLRDDPAWREPAPAVTETLFVHSSLR